MKKLFAGLILSLAAVAAMATPRPSEIENALAAHDYQSARSMTQEVLRDKPDSPKAHLFNAYVLLKSGDRGGAEAELKTARMLDTNHKVQNSALFGRTVAELESAPAQRVAPKPSYATPVTTTYVEPAGSSALVTVLKWMFYLTIIGLIIYTVYKFLESRPVKVATTRSWAETPVQSVAVEAYERPYVNQGRRYDAPAHPIYEAPARPTPAVYQAAPAPVTVVNNGGSNSNGIVEGMLLNEMMHSHHNHADYGSPRIIERDTYVERPAPAYEAPRTTDYETSRASFSAGDDDNWKRSSGSSGGSNDWDGGSSGGDSGGGGGDWD